VKIDTYYPYLHVATKLDLKPNYKGMENGDPRMHQNISASQEVANLTKYPKLF
jgi:hypothetical protein